MELNLLSLRRYAIKNRVEIKFADANSTQPCVITSKGTAQVPGEDKSMRIEDVVSSARSFEIIGKGKPQQLDRAQMTREVTRAAGGDAHHGEDDEDE